MLRSFMWMLAAGALWFGGILCEPKHKDIYTVEEGHVMVRTVMPSPTGWTLALWVMSAAAGACCIKACATLTASGNDRSTGV